MFAFTEYLYKMVSCKILKKNLLNGSGVAEVHGQINGIESIKFWTYGYLSCINSYVYSIHKNTLIYTTFPIETATNCIP
jgi:hypothetical protein